MLNHYYKILLFRKITCTVIISGALYFTSAAQCPSPEILRDSITKIEKDNSLPALLKLRAFYYLKKNAETCNLERDSFFATILYNIGNLELEVNKDYYKAIFYKSAALKINKTNNPGSSINGAIRSSLDLAYHYEDLLIYDKSLAYYDTTITLAKKIPGKINLILYSKLERTVILFKMGDYQKCIEESFAGSRYSIQYKDSINYLAFLNQHAQSLFFQDQLAESLADIDEIVHYAGHLNAVFQLASALKTKAFIYEKKNEFALANSLFKKSIETRAQTNDNAQVAIDYNDWGNFYINKLYDYSEAKKKYFIAIKYAQKNNDSSIIAMVNVNLGETMLKEKDYKNAGYYYLNALRFLKLKTGENILTDMQSKQLNLIGNKDLITEILSKKTELLLQLFKEKNDQKFLAACIKNAMVTDSVITQTRHEQSAEQSKLYWRNRTRNFFTDAMEACFLGNDTKHALYFMEKSRAVLLGDKLNELSASAYLSATDLKIEKEFQISIISKKQKLNTLDVDSKEYNNQLSAIYEINQDFDKFIKSLQIKYPAYYQYKYDDNVASLDSLQKYLSTNNSSFIHYFTNDTVAYILSITANNAKILKLAKNDFSFKQINSFLLFCSNKDSLNAFYPAFATLSNNLYKALFQPLQIPKGRVVICSDNFLLPFEALCSDTIGKDFLINNYTFSYAYSATYLLKQTTPSNAKGNFIGFAPVSFQPYLNVPSLKKSATALTQSSAYYSNTLLFKDVTATKNNFIQHIGDYTIANVFSHASADNSISEPKLYMQDSLIQLSDLQLLDHPATRLVMLSACQTNVGKNATGEGIYSLARGFASAGIPSVSATLWKADEDMIYVVSAKFNEYLSQGMSKDSALQKAKLDFLKVNRDNDKSLPYYWANIILIGNTGPLKLSSAASTNWWWMATGTTAAILALGMLVVIVRRWRIAQ